MEMTNLQFEDIKFSADRERRTIRGLVAPWNAVSAPWKDGRRFRFSREGLKAVAAKFVDLFQDHKDDGPSYGYAKAMDVTDAGLEMTFQAYDGPDGDDLLNQAASGAKTGLSVGVKIHEEDVVPDPEFPGAFLVNLAHLTEVSLVGDPSYPQARVAAVMFSANPIGEENMEDTKTEEVVEETPAALTKEDIAALIHAEFMRNKNEQEKPVKVEPRAASTEVSEPANYTFAKNGDLQNGKYDFGIDMVQGLNPQFNNLAARHRVEEFVKAQFAAEGIVTSNVNELAPTRNLPRYIDQKDYTTPVFDAINKGSVTQMNGGGTTPFQRPVKTSSSGLVSTGVEGEEPTVGTYVTANANVTPSTLRGKAAISREAWDAGTVPNLGSVIWGQMVRDYREALEANIVTTLNAATPASLGTFTAGGGTEGRTLAAQMRSNLASLQFARGGFSMGYLFAQADLYLALVGALDTTGRPLFPALGQTNADGSVSPKYGALDINGVTVLPTWALAAAGQSTVQSPYLIDPTAVDGWVDAPKRLFFDIAVSNVYLGIWGYVATVINDITGVREVLYDPTA